jgi:pyruvate,water dikinase
MRASVLLSGNREQLAAQMMNLDLLEFDASLGCPLATYEDATLALVGGKALQCWRLMKHGLPVPPAFIIPTYVYSLHVDEAGVANLINEVFSSNLGDAAARAASKIKLAEIRSKIMATPINTEVVDNLKAFLHGLSGEATVAVRSSGSAEDLASQSFAGQYDTFLYKRTAEEVCDSIKACWVSMFKAHILDYASKPVFLDAKVGDDVEPEVFIPGQKPPQMGVLIMKMVEAKSSGVCFSKNLWGEANEIMVEAVLGQGEGLVGGEITPDRYVVNKYTSKLCFQELTPQTHKFVRSSNMDGVEKVALEEPFEGSVLSPRNLKVAHHFYFF